jgi:hypothetical protein
LRLLRQRQGTNDGKAGDDDAVLSLMRGIVGTRDVKDGDDDAVSRLMQQKGGDKRIDEELVLRLMKAEGSDTHGDDGIDRGDDDIALRLMNERIGDKPSDENAVLRLMTEIGGSQRLAMNDTSFELLRLLRGRSAKYKDHEKVQKLLQEQGDSLSDELIRSENKKILYRLRASPNRMQDTWFMGKDGVAAENIAKVLSTAVKDDASFRQILDSFASQDEARISADALRFILRGPVDPVARLAHLARTRPREGRSWERAEAAQSVRDLQVLNSMLDHTDQDTEIQAWKDVGAIRMLMNDILGPDPQKLSRPNAMQTDDKAIQSIMGASSFAPPLLPSKRQAASDVQAMQTLLGQHSQSNMLQPPRLSDDNALRRLMESSTDGVRRHEDTRIIQNLMSPTSSFNSLRPTQIGSADANIIYQLMR